MCSIFRLWHYSLFMPEIITISSVSLLAGSSNNPLSLSLAVFVYCRLTFVVHLCRHSVSAKWVIHFDRKTELSLGSWIIQWGLSNVRMINACREIYIFRPCAVADNEIVVRRGVCLILINIFKPRHAVNNFTTSRNRGSIEELFLRRVRQAN